MTSLPGVFAGGDIVRGRLPIGEFARVKIVGYTDYDLIVELIGLSKTPFGGTG